eukprot:gene6043-12181_t
MSFGAKDLALILPDQVGDVFSLRHTGTEEKTDSYEPLKPKIDLSKKTTRYFPGKAPNWAEDGDSSSNIIGKLDKVVSSQVITTSGADRRLARLAATTTSTGSESRSQRRRIYEAEVVADDLLEDTNFDEISDNFIENQILEGDAPLVMALEEDEEEIQTRRARVLQKRSEAMLDDHRPEAETSRKDARIKPQVDEESESEYETDSDEYSDDDDQQMMKPVFVPKAKRETIKEIEAKREEEELAHQKKLLELEERKKQTRVMLAESIRRDEERQEANLLGGNGNDSDTGLPDDTDDADDEEEYESWKLREMFRMKRDAELREKYALEQRDVVRRRNMTETERDAEDARLQLGQHKTKEKSQWKFMQKYYHKGVFYMDEDTVAKTESDVRCRDYNAPTLEDKFDKEKLPKVLQVKNFGKRGRTKYTHLTDQDTTSFGDPLRPNETVKQSYMDKRSGVGSIDLAGRANKKQKM